MKNQALIAKITRPTLPDIFPRQRLFRLLDQASRYPVTWVTGPPGSGKTTLVASYIDARKLPCLWYQVDAGDSDIATFFYYIGLAAKKAAPGLRKPLPLLTPEYLLDVPTFSRRYFENLCSRLKPRSPSRPRVSKGGMGKFVIVFDNYQEAPQESLLHGILSAGLSGVSESIRVIIISRSDPPPAFASLLAGDKIQQIGWNELRLTADESKGIALLHLGEERNRKVLHWIQEKTGGWAVGLILLSKFIKREDVDPQALPVQAPEQVFDYFASELFEKRTDEATKDFLLKTAVLPTMTPSIAEKLTGNKNAGAILSELNRRNYFTEKRRQPELTYQYHSLFREFLLSRAKNVFSPSDLEKLYLSGARLQDQAGQIEDAADLYRAAGDETGLARMILSHAPVLVGQGRYRTLEQWLLGLSPGIRDAEPWLLFWSGVCSQPVNPPEARKSFERTFELFQGKKDRAGELLSWCGIVETFLYEWNDFTPLDRWIRWLDDHSGKGTTFPSFEIEARVSMCMAAVLTTRQPHHRRVRQWWERALALSHKSRDASIALQTLSYAANYYFWLGDLAMGWRVVQEISVMARAPQASPLAQLTWKWLEAAICIWAFGESGKTIEKINAALAYAEATGVHIWDHMLFALGVYDALMNGDLERGRKFIGNLERTLAPSRRHGYCHYHYLIAWERLLAGDLAAAQTNAETALSLAEETGFQFPVILCSLELVQVLLNLGSVNRAATHAARAHGLALRSKSAVFEYMALLAKAQVAFSRGHGVSGLRSLREGLRLGRKHGYMNQLWWRHPPSLSSLCAKALDAGIEAEYVQGLIRSHGLMPAEPSDTGERWPWPLKIFAFGTFTIEREGAPLSHARKSPKKTLELLRLLIALGGKNVSEERLMELLWPDAESGRGRKALIMTIMRLRELLGVKNALQVSEGAVSLDERLVWTDARVFAHLVSKAAEAERLCNAAESSMLLKKAVELYRGPFLDGEDRFWAIGPREHFRDGFLRAVEALGGLWERKKQWRKAAAVYAKGLAVDDLIEHLYVRTMLCFHRLGSQAEALAVYRRLQKTLGAYGLRHSDETEETYRKIISAKQES